MNRCVSEIGLVEQQQKWVPVTASVEWECTVYLSGELTGAPIISTHLRRHTAVPIGNMKTLPDLQIFIRFLFFLIFRPVIVYSIFHSNVELLFWSGHH